ncbi:ABC transporter ATP-binding protein [Micrococcus luteus]|uniref:ABC transporter n=1 Tax=Micrococcus luteus TaxID=1270 RepID=A0AAX0VIG6_MICLU|nr:ABC transporter ATP-binding protein [Micrococcus luteus]MCV7586565.1 ABC transporter ATP-binding protein [Micrococcus luteus]MCV7686552.1 ABC transporter ATP-binding protein [Micrococcus luteus]PKZ80781.1 ABC transporter [Micrococcus luteus]
MTPTTTGASLRLRDVAIRYPDGSTPVRGTDLDVAAGEIVALVGASGSGKSTILRGIAGLEDVVAGTVGLDGRDVAAVPTHRRGVGMVFQDGQLFPHRTVGRNVAYGLEAAGWDRARRRARVAELLDLVGLTELTDRPVQRLSGGQAQRVALARSLAPAPRVLLLDEPLSALDADLRRRLAEDIRAVLRAAGTTGVVVTHDLAEAAVMADRTVRLGAGGRIAAEEDGPAVASQA